MSLLTSTEERDLIAGVIVSKTARQVDKVFDYEIPEALCAATQVGSRVIVPFGRGGRLCEGFVLYLASVSYTHLDVYKRQPIRSAAVQKRRC